MCVFTLMFYMLLTAAAALTGGAAGEEVQSFLLNGDFERGTGNDVPDWSRNFYPRPSRIEGGGIGDCISRSDARARSGRWSLRIDTGSVLGEEVVLVFNGAVKPEATRLRGKRVVLTGWLYVEPGTALRPLSMRLRMFGREAKGKIVFLGDVLALKILGQPGQWVPFRAEGNIGTGDIRRMDLHCAIRPDVVRTVQFIDALRLELWQPPPLELLLPHNALWRDEPVLPVEVRVHEAKAETVRFALLTAQGISVGRWTRPARTAIYGLPGPKRRLPEGTYRLRATLLDGEGRPLATEEAKVELAASPWEDAPEVRLQASEAPHRSVARPADFRVRGRGAPTELPDAKLEATEPLSPDLDLSSWEERGYVVFARHYLEPVSRRARPRPGEFGPVRLFACPGEYEPATISVWARRPQKGVRVWMSDLMGEGGRIPASQVDVSVVRTIRGLPPFLERREAVDIPPDETQRFWLTFYVPPGTQPGFYSGTLTVAPRDGPATRVTVWLRVLPLRLPPPSKGYGFWWKMDARWNGYYSKERDTVLERIRRQFILLREHGCNMVSCYTIPKMTRPAEGPIVFDFTQDLWGHSAYSLADFLRLGRETGFLSPKVPIQYVGADLLRTYTGWLPRMLGIDPRSPAFEAFYRDACRRIDRWAKEQGFTLAFACVDEIGNSPERRQAALRFYRLAREAGVLTSVTDNSMHAGVHLMGQKRFDDLIAMRLYNFITPEMMEHTRRSGDHLWLYNMGSGGWRAKRDRFVFGLFTERCGAEGYSQWAFQWPPGTVNPYEAAAAGQRSGYHYALPAPEGPLPTLALEGVREGIDDARYLALLPPASRPAFLKDVEPLSLRIPEYLERHRGSFFDVRRWRMARQAMGS